MNLLNPHQVETANSCIQCGLCLPTCPTYILSGKEVSSPRGRIQQIKYFNSNPINLSDEFISEMNYCLDCQACETACPAGVKYGSLVESARNFITTENQTVLKKYLKKILLNGFFSNQKRFIIISKILRFFQNISFFNLVKIFNRKILLFPNLNQTFYSENNLEFYLSIATKRFSVALLTGCIMDIAFKKIHDDTIEVLRQQGCDVYIPKMQGCCGSIHGHNGEHDEAKRLANLLKSKFNVEKFDAIISNSAGCGAFIKEYPINFDSSFSTFSNKVLDFAEFLSKINFIPSKNKLNVKVTYHDACHLAHSQKISSQPRDLIKLISGIEYKELNESSWCCGSAGVYNITHFEDSIKILDRKMENINKTETEFCVASNPGCIIQLEYGAKKSNSNVKIIHLATLLRMTYV